MRTTDRLRLINMNLVSRLQSSDACMEIQMEAYHLIITSNLKFLVIYPLFVSSDAPARAWMCHRNRTTFDLSRSIATLMSGSCSVLLDSCTVHLVFPKSFSLNWFLDAGSSCEKHFVTNITCVCFSRQLLVILIWWSSYFSDECIACQS